MKSYELVFIFKIKKILRNILYNNIKNIVCNSIEYTSKSFVKVKLSTDSSTLKLKP